MSQHDYSLANQDTASFRGDLNYSLLATVGLNSGGTAPATTYAYMLWADTSSGFLKIRNAANSAWITIGTLASTNLGILALTAGQQMSGALSLPAFADIASSGTTAIGGATTNFVRITGVTTITSFGTIAAGVWRMIRFAGALTLTHNGTSLILPGSANIATAANDTAWAISLGGGNWIVMFFQRASGRALIPGGALSNLSGVNSLTNNDHGKFLVCGSGTTVYLPHVSSLQNGWYTDFYNASPISGVIPGDNIAIVSSVNGGCISGDLDTPWYSYIFCSLVGANYTRCTFTGSLFDFNPRCYEATDFTPTAGSSLIQEHGLAARAKSIAARLICNSNQNGYIVGEQVMTAWHPQQTNASPSFGLSVTTASSLALLRVAIATNGLLINNKSSGVAEAFIEAAWTLRVSIEA